MPCITASESNFSEPSVKKPKLEPKESEIEEIEVIDVPEIEVKIEHIENDYPTQALATPHCSKDKSQVSSGGFFGIFPQEIIECHYNCNISRFMAGILSSGFFTGI